MPYVFDLDRLKALAAQTGPQFRAADPYPHAVYADFLKEDAARELTSIFPKPEDRMVWDRFGAHGLEVKMGSSDEAAFPAPLRQAIHDLNSGPFLRFLEAVSGIGNLLPDPYLVGGGIHLSRQGDHLGIHADFNWHEGIKAHRRLNLLIYLSPHWEESYGGELELWDTTGTRRVSTIAPLFNRAVLFTTRSDTFHGHPNPWAAPPDVYRRSIALYYYTAERPAEETRPAHGTLYKGYNV